MKPYQQHDPDHDDIGKAEPKPKAPNPVRTNVIVPNDRVIVSIPQTSRKHGKKATRTEKILATRNRKRALRGKAPLEINDPRLK